ncbi:GLUG motif-containing protein [Virgibacillus halodenitrificans]|uniref:GLUG motif-containing protein n=1 Tax=Virgibacillus halodenitrificans TaxID=1482 RepID=UPI000EF4B644|nr:GLUG motif-containing protein [Virgibacillus halodenitrificans]
MKKTTKKVITASLVTPLAVTSIPINFGGLEVEAAEVEIIEISSAQELYSQLRNKLDGNFKLISNIDLSGINWQPISNFKGTFDGDGHTISNLTINKNGHAGLFANTYFADIKNVILENPNINSSGDFTGALVGETERTTIENVGVEGGTIIGGNTTGGLVGHNHNYSTIKKAYSTAEVNGQEETGGLVGYNEQGSSISDAYTTGDVTGGNSTGGVIGYNANESSLSNAYATGNVSGETQSGGVIGYNNDSQFDAATISNVFALNSSVSGSKGLGKAVGRGGTRKGVNIIIPETMKGIGGLNAVTGLVSNEQVTKQSTYQSFDFANTWTMDPNSGLPTLQFAPQTLEKLTLGTTKTAIKYKGELYNAINTPDELNDMRNDVANNYKLMNNIDLSSINWQPISNFKGTFDGDGHTISNLTINKNGHAGLFASTYYADIKNVILENPNINSSGDYTGALVGETERTTIKNVGVEGGTITGGNTTGGLVGHNYKYSTIKSAYSTAKVNGQEETGGLVGSNNQSSSITDAYTTGDVAGGNSTGGVIGYNADKSSLLNAYATGNVSGETYSGGVVGKNSNFQYSESIISNIFALNSSVSGSNGTGKAVGNGKGKKISSVTAISTMSGNGQDSEVTNTITPEKALQKATYVFADFDFGDLSGTPTWSIDEGDTLPYLVSMPQKTSYDKNDGTWFDPEKPKNQVPSVGQEINGVTIQLDKNPTHKIDISNVFKDADGDSLTYTVTSNKDSVVQATLDGTNINLTGLVEGSSLITVTAEDGNGGTVSETFYVNVVEEVVQPEFTKATIQFAAIPNATEYILHRNGKEVARISDDGSDFYTYEDTNLIAGQTYVYVVHPVFEDGKDEGISLGDIQTLNLDINVSVSQNEGTASWNNIYGAEGYQVIIKDSSGKTLTEKEVSADTTSLTTTMEKAGKYTVEVTPKLNGTYGEGQSKSFAIEEDLNEAPSASDIPDQQLIVDDAPITLDLSQYFTDPNGDQITYQVTTDNEDVTVSNNEGSLTIIPKTVGQSVVTVTASDGELTVEKTFTVVVEAKEDRPEVENVKNIKVSLNETTASITWDKLSEATAYRVQAYVKNEEGNFVKDSYARRVTENAYDYSRLDVGKEYKFEIIPFIDNVYQNEYAGISDRVMVNEPEGEKPAIEVVQNVSASVNGTDATITWDSLEGATRYRVQAYVQDPVTGEFRKDGFARTTSGTAMDMSQLDEGKTYKFHVIPNVDNVYTSEAAGVSNEVTTESKVVEEQPSVDATLHVTMDGTTANLSWDAIEDASRYRIQMYVKDEFGVFVKDGYAKSVSSTEVALTGLKEGTEYKFEITPRVGYIYSDDYMISATAETGNVEEPSEPSTNSTVTVELEGTTANVTWDGIEDASRYRVQKYVKNEETGEFEKDSYAKTASDTTITLTRLDEGAEYKFEVIPLIKFSYDYKSSVTSDVVKVEVE